MKFRRAGLVVHWLGGGLYLEKDGQGLLVDVPVAAVPALRNLGALGRVTAVMLTSGRPQAVEGLVPFLCALEPLRDAETPLTVWSCLGEERGTVLSSAWMRAWPGAFPLIHDGVMPGSTFEAEPFVVRTRPVRHGEPRWSEQEVVPAVGVAVSIEAGGVRIAWVPGAAPGPAVQALCAGAALAVVEVGVRPWPQSAARWRLTNEEALRATGTAGEVWLVGDDGTFGLPGEEN